MSVDQVIGLLVTVTLFEMMATVGLGVTFAELWGVATNARLLAWAALANYLIVPAAAVGLLLLFNAQPLVATGFLILALCPGAPYGPPFAAAVRGNVAAAVGLMVLLAGSSAVLAPVLLSLLLPLVAENEPLAFDPASLVGMLLLTQLAPLCLGLAVRQWRPALAERLQRPARLVSALLNLAAVGLILAVHGGLLLDIPARAYFGMVLLLATSWAAGWLPGTQPVDLRRTTTLTAALRNVGVGLVIASGAFPGTPAVTAVLAYGLFALLASLLLALAWSRRLRPAAVPP
jgi:BASS family bile acid:Na+ symporter